MGIWETTGSRLLLGVFGSTLISITKSWSGALLSSPAMFCYNAPRCSVSLGSASETLFRLFRSHHSLLLENLPLHVDRTTASAIEHAPGLPPSRPGKDRACEAWIQQFRRFRITHLEKSDCPEALKHFWSGHAPKHASEQYVKL